MRLNSHRTLISIISDAIDAWRKPLLKKREDVADAIVKAHHDIGGVETTGIWIEPESSGRAEALRQKANADRVFRWLDDREKDNNLLPANFLPSLLAGLPMQVRIQCMNEALSPCGLSVRPVITEAAEFSPLAHLSDMLREGGEANQAMAAAMNSNSIESLEHLQMELVEAAASFKGSLSAVEAELARRRDLKVVAA